MLKYVILNNCYPILFPGNLVHSEVAEAIGGRKVTSAGFCQIVAGEVMVSGGSISLDVDSHPDDAQLIKRAVRQMEGNG